MSNDKLGKLIDSLLLERRCLCCNFLISETCLPFCMKCGTKNPYFSLKDMLEEEGHSSIEEAQKKECPSWHRIQAHGYSFEDSLRNIEEYPHCPYCGKKIMSVGAS